MIGAFVMLILVVQKVVRHVSSQIDLIFKDCAQFETEGLSLLVPFIC